MAHILMIDNKGTAYGQGGNMRLQLGAGGSFKADGVSFGKIGRAHV